MDLKGIWAAVATPLLPSKEIDIENWVKLAQSLAEASVDGLFFFGSTGEGPAIPIRHRLSALRTLVAELRGRIPMTVGAMPSMTAAAIEEICAFQELGVSGIVVTTPYYFTPESTASILRHFEALHESARVPLVVYNVPVRTGTMLSAEVIAKLAEFDRIIGVKDSSGNLGHVQTLIRFLRHRSGFFISDGSEDNWMFSVLAGAHGATLGIANVCAALCVKAWMQLRKGDLQSALATNQRIIHVRDTVFRQGSAYGGLKEALCQLGFGGRTVSLPIMEVSSDARQVIHRMLVEEGLLAQ